ncbi:MAG: RNA-binding S4 domain-containing protein [Novosphingobium sp.]
MRIDKLLWYLRLASSRNFAQQWVLAGHIRVNGRRIDKPGATVAPGDVLTLPMRINTRVIELQTLPNRRGPAPEAQACYRVLDGRAANLIGPGNQPEGTSPP